MSVRAALVCAALGLFATAGGSAAQPRDTLVVGMNQFPPDLHPLFTGTTTRTVVLRAMSRAVVSSNRDGSYRCDLCTVLPSLENGGARVVTRADGNPGMEVTYALKPDLFWADGVPVTARDVAFSFKVSSAFNPPPFTEQVEALDDLHVRYTLRSPIFDYQNIANGWILSEHIEGPIFAASASVKDYGDRSAMNRHPEQPGLWFGPYRVASFNANDQVVLTQNPFWKGTRPWFRQVTFRLIENTSAMMANLLSGDIDTVNGGNTGLTIDQAMQLAKTQADRFDVAFQPGLTGYEHLAFNLDNPLFADRRVRHAMAMAIDRKAIVAKLFDNRFEVATSFLHPSQFGFDPAVPAWSYDPKAARALLAEAGFRPGADGILVSPTGARFSVDLTTTAGLRIRELIEQVIQTQMRAVGIEIVVKNVPARVLFGETLRHRQFTGLVEFSQEFALGGVPADLFSQRYIPSEANNWSGNNFMDWRNPAMEEALRAARTELGPEQRKRQWQVILSQYAEEMPEIPLYFASSDVITPRWLTGLYNPTRFGSATNWIEDWRPR